MALARDVSRRPLIWLLLVLGTGGALLLCLQFGGASMLDVAREREAEQGAEAADRQAQGEGASAKEAPTLSGRATEPKATHGPVVVLVRDRSGAPVRDVEVEVFDLEVGQETPGVEVLLVGARTDAAGRASFPDLPYDGSLTATVRRVEGDPLACADLTLSSGHYVLTRTPTSISFRPAAEQAIASGQAKLTHFPPPSGPFASLESRWRVSTAVTGPTQTLELDGGLPFRLEVREGGRGRVRDELRCDAWPQWTRDPMERGEATLAVLPGDASEVRCRIAAPRGWVAVAEEVWNVEVHPLAHRLEAITPLRPEADIVLEVPEVCRPFRLEDCDLTVTVAQTPLRERALESLGPGLLRVRGAGFLPGDSVLVRGSIGTTGRVQGTGQLEDDPRARTLVRLTAAAADPTIRTPRIDLTNRLTSYQPRGCTPPTNGRTEVYGPQFKEWWQDAHRKLTERAVHALALRILAWDGVPAAGARVTLGERTQVADATGHVRFDRVAQGDATVRVLGAGATSQHEVAVSDDGRVRVLNAPAGGVLDVEVVDDAGHGLPYPNLALARADGLPHLEAVDGVQRLDPYGDAAGRRTYRFVGAGEVTVTAAFGSRTAQSTVTVIGGGRQPVRLVLPRLRAEPPPEAEAR